MARYRFHRTILVLGFILRNIAAMGFIDVLGSVSSQFCSASHPGVNSLFWFGLDKCQVPTKAALSLLLLNWTGERKYDERLKGRGKDRERSLAAYCHKQNRLNLGRKGSSFYHQTNQSRIMRNKTRA